MEAPLEDETPAGAVARTEGPEDGEELKASDEATTFMSSTGELSAHFPGESAVSTGGRDCVPLRVSTTWSWHISSCPTLIEVEGKLFISRELGRHLHGTLTILIIINQ